MKECRRHARDRASDHNPLLFPGPLADKELQLIHALLKEPMARSDASSAPVKRAATRSARKRSDLM